MAKRPTQLGPLTSPWNRKYNHEGFPRPGGVNSQSDPAAIGPDQFTKLINVRWKSDGMRPRSGYSQVANTVFHNAAASVYPDAFEISTPFRAWYVGQGFPCESSANGRFIGFYDPESDPILQRVAWYSTATAAAVGSLGNTPFVGIDDTLRRLNLLQAPFGQDQSSIAGQSTDVPVHTWTGETVKLLVPFDGMLFVCLDAGTDHIVTFDGVSIREDSDFTAVPVAAGHYRDLLIVGLDDGKLYSRVAGDSPVTWTLLGTVTGGVHPGRNSIISHKDILYILNGEDDIWTWNDAALANTHTIGAAEVITCLAEAFGYLYYGYRDAGTTEVHVGRFDASGPTWDDTHKRLTDDDADIDNISGMLGYKNELIAMPYNSPGIANHTLLARTSGQDTAGTWVYAQLDAFWTGDFAGLVPYMVAI